MEEAVGVGNSFGGETSLLPSFTLTSAGKM